VHTGAHCRKAVAMEVSHAETHPSRRCPRADGLRNVVHGWHAHSRCFARDRGRPHGPRDMPGHAQRQSRIPPSPTSAVRVWRPQLRCCSSTEVGSDTSVPSPAGGGISCRWPSVLLEPLRPHGRSFMPSDGPSPSPCRQAPPQPATSWAAERLTTGRYIVFTGAEVVQTGYRTMCPTGVSLGVVSSWTTPTAGILDCRLPAPADSVAKTIDHFCRAAPPLHAP
jgi:hypothetical protein